MVAMRLMFTVETQKSIVAAGRFKTYCFNKSSVMLPPFGTQFFIHDYMLKFVRRFSIKLMWKRAPYERFILIIDVN